MIRPLTSQRFLFALMVFGWHCPFYTDPDSIGFKISKALWANGYVGVSFFFILSGFILSLNYADYFLEKGISKRDFWIMRFARIYPLYLVTLLVEIPFTMHEYHADAGIWWAKLLTCGVMLQSWVPDEHWVCAFNIPSWSISTEAFFYAVFPLLAVRLKGVRRGVLVSAIVLLSLLVAMFLLPSAWHKVAFYYNPIGRLGEFVLGIVLFRIYQLYRAKQWTYRQATLLEVTSVAAFIVFYSFHEQVPPVYRLSVYYWPSMVFLLYIFARSEGALSKGLSAPALVLLGEVSFAFYMIHYRVGGMLKIANYRFMHIEQASLAYFLIYFLATLVASVALHFLFERPANQYLRRRLLSAPKAG